MMCACIRCCHQSSAWCPISILTEPIDLCNLNFPADIQQDALCRDINRPFINATKSSAIWPWSKHIFTQKDKATIYISKGIFCVQASSTVYIQVLSFNIASAAKCSHSSALPWCQHWLIPEKVPFQKKKKTQQSVEQHSSKFSYSDQRCKGMSHSLRWYQKEKYSKSQAEQTNPSAFQLTPATATSMPCSYGQDNSTTCLLGWAKPKAFSFATAQCR